MKPNKLLLSVAGLMGIVALAACQGKPNTSASSQVSSMSSVSTSLTSITETIETSETMQTSEEQKEVKEAVKTFEPGTLLTAVNQRNLDQVREILQDPNYVIDEVDGENNTPLNIAVHNNDVEIAKLLIDRGADINKQNTISDSPYLYAGAQGRTEILTYMLGNAEPDLTVHNRFGGNALIPAAEKGHIDNVKLLLADGREDIDFQNNYGYTALIEAVGLREGNELYQEIVRVLMDNGANQHIKDNSGRTAMDYAVEKGYTEINAILSQYD
ncbi:ankyrin repeat domain-containing protein [Enterococcus sp. BWM-S5]|uniref:Ankyrin repeat domain-containing protein n=1 Tax=Enterococcus larvae TaxID=2794352 RepID=A0ABS4CLA4_9ENTE|nr:ankyrin repeat domain-containing protein [Enterococcus larvae]MBP1047346.1 ankyrin repeat domain-containing protein [Enterococcus larvae]